MELLEIVFDTSFVLEEVEFQAEFSSGYICILRLKYHEVGDLLDGSHYSGEVEGLDVGE